MSKTIITFIDDEKRPDREIKIEGHPFDYVRVFDKDNTYWDRNLEYNKYFVKNVEQHVNDILTSRGYVFLNEIYSMLGLHLSKCGQLVGWIKSTEDKYIDLGLNNDVNRRFNNGEINSIIIEPNVDGEILSKL